MTAVYFVASLFVVSNFVLCFHSDGTVYLELSKVQEIAGIADDANSEAASDCDDEECSDRSINDFTLSFSNAKAFDTDNSDWQLSELDFLQSLTPEAASHNGWRSDPPPQTHSHYTSVLKPTLIIQI